MTDLNIAALRAVADAATQGPWHWAGNTDTGEPYLATWIKGAGRCQVLSIGHEDRDPDGREAKSMRASLEDCGYEPGRIDAYVDDWATDAWGQPRKDVRLEFMTDLMLVNARDLAIYEVAPSATSREDPRVYRADITGIRHPDAEHIATFDPPTIRALLDRIDHLEAVASEQEALQRAMRKLEAVQGIIAALQSQASNAARELSLAVASIPITTTEGSEQ